MFQLTIRIPHIPGDRAHDTTWLSRKHDHHVRRLLDDLSLYAVAEITWRKRHDHTRAICTVTAYPEVKAAA